MSTTEDVKASETEELNAPDSTTVDTTAVTNPTVTTTSTATDVTEDDIAAAQPLAASSRSSSGSGNGNGKRERDEDRSGGNGDDEDEETISAAATKLLKSSDDSDNTTGGGDTTTGGLLSGRSSTSVEDLPTTSTATVNITAGSSTIAATETPSNVGSESLVEAPQVSSAEAVPKATEGSDIAPTNFVQNPSGPESATETEPVSANAVNEGTTTKAAPAPLDNSNTATTTDPRAAMTTSNAPAVTAVPTLIANTAPPSGGVDPNVAATISNPEQLVEETGVVSAQYVGRVIGKGGEMIRDLQARSGARIDVDQNVPIGQPRVITYRGTRETVDFAKHLVQMLCTDGVSDTDLPLGNAAQEYLIIPAQSVGKVIGRGGEMIRELQSRSQAKIQIDHTGQSGIPTDQKQVTITGTHEAVVKGKEMVLLLVANPLMDAQISLNMLIDDKIRGGSTWGSGPPYKNLPNQGMNMQPHMAQSQQQFPGMAAQPPGYGMYGQPPMAGGAPPMQHGNPMMGGGGGGYPQQQQSAMAYGAPPMGGAGFQQPQTMYMSDGRESELLFVSKQFMGRIIGSKGVTINDLQRRSQCDIQINQDVPPGKDCEITVKGTRQGIDMAKAMIQEIIEVGPHHPYAGGMENYGTKNVGGYHGGSFAPQHQQQSQQYNPYQQPQPSMYDQGAAYGQPAYAPQGNAGYTAPMMGGPSYGQPMPQPQQSVPYQQQPQQQQQPTPYGAVGGGYMPVPQQQQQIPMVAAAVPRQQPPMPPQPTPAASLWKAASSPDGQIYYYNERTGETQWEKPPGMP